MNWDETFMEMALVVSKRSKDPRRQVGAVLVSPKKNHVAIGYNGFPRGIEETNERWDDKYKYVVHAEENAILNAKCDLEDWTLYVTLFPCTSCTNKILQSGVSRIVYLDTNSKSLNDDSINLSLELFEEMDIKIERF